MRGKLCEGTQCGQLSQALAVMRHSVPRSGSLRAGVGVRRGFVLPVPFPRPTLGILSSGPRVGQVLLHRCLALRSAQVVILPEDRDVACYDDEDEDAPPAQVKICDMGQGPTWARRARSAPCVCATPASVRQSTLCMRQGGWFFHSACIAGHLPHSES